MLKFDTNRVFSRMMSDTGTNRSSRRRQSVIHMVTTEIVVFNDSGEHWEGLKQGKMKKKWEKALKIVNFSKKNCIYYIFEQN